MNYYSLGFIFDPEMEHVLLIHKNRPEWQKGKINGPGGKIEPGEAPIACISREIKEEAGLLIPLSGWTHIGEMTHPEWNVHVFASTHRGKKEEAQSLTDEKLEWFPINQIPTQAITNLHWLIPLCRERLSESKIKHSKIEYTNQ